MLLPLLRQSPDRVTGRPAGALRDAVVARARRARASALAQALLTAATLTACGGGADGSGPAGPDPSVPASVTVAPGSATLDAVGATTTLSAQVRNAAGEALGSASVNWSSEGSSVATVNASGVVTAVSAGTATIRASSGTVSGTATITVAPAIATLSVSPANDTLVIGTTAPLTVSATDRLGGAIASPVVTWSTGDAAIASVAASGVVTAVAVGSTQITATSGAVSASATITVKPPPLRIVSDTTLSGTIAVDTFEIASGITVTASGPLTIRASGPIAIAGTLVGECRTFDLVSDTAFTVTGTIGNGCAAGTAAPLRLSATGELTLDGATITSSGDITIANDPSLDDGSFAANGSRLAPRDALAAALTGRGVTNAGAGVPFTRMRNATVRYHAGGTGPNPAKPGADGVNGGDGDNGRSVKFFLNGNAVFEGGVTLWGQDGGAGGTGSDTKPSDVTTTGGDGGDGGLIRVRVSGTLTYSGSNNIVRAGAGGRGGDAVATAQANGTPSNAPSASATGGEGGTAGLIDIAAGGGITIADGALALELKSGDGGDAVATAADGVHAGTNGRAPAQPGGAATARGGKGADTPDRALFASGVSGTPIVRESFGTGEPGGGRGGDASVLGGRGGDGLKGFGIDGAIGGSMNAIGGAGGARRWRVAASGNPIGKGGTGGSLDLFGGRGGNGWDGCSVSPPEMGGSGGRGGNTSGARGAGGAPDGTDGGSFLDAVGNGGDAGNGAGPGTPGPAGTDGVNPAGAKTIAAASFEAGAAGTDCTPPPPQPSQTSVLISQPGSPGVVSVGTYDWLLQVNGETRGRLPVSADGPANNNFYGLNPLRVGQSSQATWTIRVGDAEVDDAAYAVGELQLCVTNTAFSLSGLEEDGGFGGFANHGPFRFEGEVQARALDGSFVLLALLIVTSNTCQLFALPPAAQFVVIATTVAFADWYLGFLRRRP